MKKWLSILLLFSITLTVANFTLPYVWYYSNYEYVSTELCIHQHRSDHDCNGLCQLKSMFQEQYHHDHDSSKQIVKRDQQVNLFTSNYIISVTPLHSLYLLITEENYVNSLWFGETSVPPPQLS